MEYTSPALDPAALKNLSEMVDGDMAFLADLVATFFRNAPQLLRDMHQAIERGDAAALTLAAHSLKSNSATFGATALTALCRELELMGKSGALAGAAEKMAQAETEYERIKPAIAALGQATTP